MTNRGKFIVLEGLDKSGKTSQISRLNKLLVNSRVIRFPYIESKSGQELVSYLKGEKQLAPESAMKLFAKNRVDQNAHIIQLLLQGHDVLCDRYSHSGVVYAMTNGIELVKAANYEHGTLIPDAVFYLDISPEEAAKRGDHCDRFENITFQEGVYEHYKLFRHEFQVIDALLPEDKISQLILSYIANIYTGTLRKRGTFSNLAYSTWNIKYITE